MCKDYEADRVQNNLRESKWDEDSENHNNVHSKKLHVKPQQQTTQQNVSGRIGKKKDKHHRHKCTNHILFFLKTTEQGSATSHLIIYLSNLD